MKKMLTLFGLFCCFHNILKAQDAKFLNNNQSLLLLNPSFAGSNDNWRVQSSFNNIQLSYASIDAFIKPIKGAFAITYLGDNGVFLKDQRMSLVYAQHFTVGEEKIKLIPSLEFTYIQRTLDGGLTSSSSPYLMLPPTSRLGYSKKNLNFSAGLLLNYKKISGGFSVKHLTQPDIGTSGSSRLPASINIHASYTKTLNEKSFVQFFTLYNHQATINTIALNTNAVLMKHLVLGLGFASNAQSSMSLGYRNNSISSVLSFGKDFSKLAGPSNYQANLSLAFSLKKKSQRNWIGNFEKW